MYNFISIIYCGFNTEYYAYSDEIQNTVYLVDSIDDVNDFYIADAPSLDSRFDVEDQHKKETKPVVKIEKEFVFKQPLRIHEYRKQRGYSPDSIRRQARDSVKKKAPFVTGFRIEDIDNHKTNSPEVKASSQKHIPTNIQIAKHTENQLNNIGSKICSCLLKQKNCRFCYHFNIVELSSGSITQEAVFDFMTSDDSQHVENKNEEQKTLAIYNQNIVQDQNEHNTKDYQAKGSELQIKDTSNDSDLFEYLKLNQQNDSTDQNEFTNEFIKQLAVEQQILARDTILFSRHKQISNINRCKRNTDLEFCKMRQILLALMQDLRMNDVKHSKTIYVAMERLINEFNRGSIEAAFKKKRREKQELKRKTSKKITLVEESDDQISLINKTQEASIMNTQLKNKQKALIEHQMRLINIAYEQSENPENYIMVNPRTLEPEFKVEVKVNEKSIHEQELEMIYEKRIKRDLEKIHKHIIRRKELDPEKLHKREKIRLEHEIKRTLKCRKRKILANKQYIRIYDDKTFITDAKVQQQNKPQVIENKQEPTILRVIHTKNQTSKNTRNIRNDSRYDNIMARFRKIQKNLNAHLKRQ